MMQVLFDRFAVSTSIAERSAIAEEILSNVLKIYETSMKDDALARRRMVKEKELRKWMLLRRYVEEHGTLLDCGFGSGRDLLIAAEQGYKVYGCELCFKYYHDFVSLHPDAQDNIRREDMRNMSFHGGMFDVVRHNASFLHMPIVAPGYTVHKVLEESWRVLKPNGVMYIYTKAGDGYRLVDTKEGFGPRPFQFFTESSLSQVLSECGFKVEYIHTLKKDRVVKREDGSAEVQSIPWVEAIARKALK